MKQLLIAAAIPVACLCIGILIGRILWGNDAKRNRRRKPKHTNR